MRFRLSIAIVPASLLLASCAYERIGQRDPGFGEAVKYNAAVQTINPDPLYPEGTAEPGAHGEKAALAVQRYREGEVKEVEMMETTTGGGGPQ